MYHSLYNRKWLKKYKKLNKNPFILEIEDVFSSLSKRNKRFKREEWQLFNLASGSICINDIVQEKLSDKVTNVISYGSYTLPTYYRTKKEDAKIKIVYAGVIEQERKAAFLAVESMQYLSGEYELHILGFGRKEDIDALQNLIFYINAQIGKTCIYFHGKKNGDEYYRFLQNCDIALSTHSYDENTIEAANHTFPSKVLVYMANGLRVVAQNLEVLRRSKIGDLLYFYDSPKPECLAKAIQNIDISQPYDSRKKIEELDERFKSEVKKLLGEI